MNMRKARQSGIERLENSLVKLIQEKGADQHATGAVALFLAFLKGGCKLDGFMAVQEGDEVGLRRGLALGFLKLLNVKIFGE